MIWFTADWHLDHANILDFEKERQKICNNKISKMNDALIYRYNQYVDKNDTCYFLGDFSLRNSDNWPHYQRTLNRLHGNKHLILGNHDKLNPFLYVECGFITVHTALNVEEFVLVHDPACCTIDKEANWLCGHVHSLFKLSQNKNVLNVGIDVWDYLPVNIDQARKQFSLVT